MSTVKISQLPVISAFAGANTSNITFVGVDLSDDKTGQFSGTTLAQNLYLNNSLVVGNNAILFPNTVAQFSGTVNNYMQINSQNFNPNGTTDLILTADTGTNSNSFIDLGINNSQFNPVYNQQTSQFPYDGYLFVQGPGQNNVGNLVLGTAITGANVVFAVGGYYANNIVATLTANGLVMNTGTRLVFADGTSLNSTNTITNLNTYTVFAYAEANSAWTLANSASANTITQNGVNTTQNTNIQLAWNQANNTLGVDSTQNTNIQLAWNQANTSIQNTANIIIPGNVTLSGVVTFTQPTIHTSNLITYGVVNTIGTLVTTGNTIANGLTTINGTLINNGNTYNNGVTFLQGQLLPNTSGISIGSANAPFQNIYTTNSTISFSNSNLTIGGTLTSNGISTFNGAVYIENNSYNANVGSLEIIGSNNFTMVPPAANGCMVHITGLDGVSTKTIQDNFSSGGTYGVFTNRSARGTAASPSATQSGDIISRFAGSGYGTTGFSSTQVSYMQVVALENHSDTNKGSQLVFATIPVGSNVTTTGLTLTSNTAQFTGNVVSNTLVYSSNATAPVVTQLTSRSTSVTANGTSGQIIGYSGTAWQHQTGYVFTVNNSSVLHNTDIVFVSVQSSNCPLPQVSVANTRVGSFDVAIFNAAGAGNDASYTMNLNFGIIRVGS